MATHHHDHDIEHSGIIAFSDLTSVGIDIGSSTSHLIFSHLFLGYPAFHKRRPEVIARKIISRSPIVLTQFMDDWKIDAAFLRSVVDSAFREAGLTATDVDTGAVIITGEAARRENARQIAELFSDRAGRFVCATAGPMLETILGAHGSGAVNRSRANGLTLLNVDMGGGTTKVSLIQNGRILRTAAMNIGARLLAFNEARRLVRLEREGARFLSDLGYGLMIGDKIEDEVLFELAYRMADVLFDMMAGKTPPWKEVCITAPPEELPKIDGLIFSGGVSEYIYGREQRSFGDLGPMLGRQAKMQAEKRGYPILAANECIRATVIGASQYSVQFSGETIFIPSPTSFPIRNLRIVLVNLSWQIPIESTVENSLRNALARQDQEIRGTPFALAISTPSFLGYGAAENLAKGIKNCLLSLPHADWPQVLVFKENIARVVGRVLSPETGVPCIDEVSLSDLDFIDIGTVTEEGHVPVVIKSLAFEV